MLWTAQFSLSPSHLPGFHSGYCYTGIPTTPDPKQEQITLSTKSVTTVIIIAIII
jgi:hypothetical protein